jgi:hypothetical protein
MLKNLFGGKKSNFYLELKETDGEKPAAVTTEAPAPAPVVEAPAPAAEPAAAPVAEKKAKKTSVKKEKKAKGKEAPASAPAPVAAAPAQPAKVEPKEVEFATKFLISPSLSRRRPGPSLNGFKDMARKAKVPINRG